jgi:SP family sugar:H+ symporter-like MFS transporter
LIAVLVVYLSVIEGQGRTLEEIDTMYILHMKPWESSKWVAPLPEEMVAKERLTRSEISGAGVDLEQNDIVNARANETPNTVLNSDHSG